VEGTIIINPCLGGLASVIQLADEGVWKNVSGNESSDSTFARRFGQYLPG
jgi:hypothetical protein